MQHDRRFMFWQKWLFYSSLLFAGFGIILALYGDNFLFRPYFNLLAGILWDRESLPSEINTFRAVASGPLGGTIACAYILLAYLAKYPFKNRERWSRNAIIAAFGAWFIIDSAVCLYYGIYFQVWIINLISLLQKALPLIFTWSQFRKV